MKAARRAWIFGLVLAGMAAAWAGGLGGEEPATRDPARPVDMGLAAGAEECARCHGDVHATWACSTHALTVRSPEEAGLFAHVGAGLEARHPPGATYFSATADGQVWARTPGTDGEPTLFPVTMTLRTGADVIAGRSGDAAYFHRSVRLDADQPRFGNGRRVLSRGERPTDGTFFVDSLRVDRRLRVLRGQPDPQVTSDRVRLNATLRLCPGATPPATPNVVADVSVGDLDLQGVEGACRPEWLERLRNGLLDAVRDGRLPVRRIDESVARIMALKERYGAGPASGEGLSRVQGAEHLRIVADVLEEAGRP